MSTTSVNPLEKEIEKKVCKYAESKGILSYKFVSPARRAVPDRIFIMQTGFIFFIEFKRKGEKPTVLQYREHERITAQGALVYVVDEIKAGIALIDELLQAINGLQMRQELEEMMPQNPFVPH